MSTAISAPHPRIFRTVGLIGLAAVAFHVLFYDRLFYFFRLMATPENNYGYLLIALGLFVVWQRLPALRRHRTSPSWFGPLLVLFGLTVAALGEIALLMRFTYFAFFIVLTGLLLTYFGNRAFALLIAPLIMFVLAVPIPGYISVQLSTSLQMVSSSLGAELLWLMGVPVFQDGNIIDLGAFQLQVAEACSGLRYLIPLSLISLCLVWLARAPLWGKLVTLAAVVPLTVFLNSFRIAMTGVLVEYRGVGAAEGFMHLFEGWLIFLVALTLLSGILFATTWLAYGISRSADVLDFDRIEGETASGERGPAATALPIFVSPPMVVGVGLIGAVALAMPALATRDQVVPDRPALLSFPLTIGDFDGTPRALDPVVRRTLGATDQLLVDYSGSASTPPINLWVAYYATQVEGGTIHSPKECLPAGGWEYERLARHEIEVAGAPRGRTFAVNEAVAVNGNERIVMVYWIEARGRKLASELKNKLYNLYDIVTSGRSDGALVRLFTRVDAEETDAAALERLYGFLDTAYVHLRPHVADTAR